MSELNPPTSPLAPAVSPFTEADAGSINELIGERIDALFNTSPLEKDAEGNYVLTDKNLKLMREYYRRERQRFLLESQAKEAAGPTRKKKPVPTSVADALNASEDLL